MESPFDLQDADVADQFPEVQAITSDVVGRVEVIALERLKGHGITMVNAHEWERLIISGDEWNVFRFRNRKSGRQVNFKVNLNFKVV